MQYSPKLKRVMQEIKDILSREDIAGIIMIHEPGFSEYLLKLDPTYSCAKITLEGIRLKAKKEDHKLNPDQQKKLVEDTFNMIHCFNAISCRVVPPLMDTEDLLKAKFKIDISGSGFSDHSTQNN